MQQRCLPYQKSCQEQEILLVELEGREREHKLVIDQLHVDIKIKEAIIANLEDENSKQKDKIDELDEENKTFEEELKKAENLEEMEELMLLVKLKNNKVEELEEALRQSVTFASEIETEKKEEETRMMEITRKVRIYFMNFNFH